MKLSSNLFFAIFIIIFFPYASRAGKVVTIKVAVAANLAYPIKELKKDFESKNSDIILGISTGSSGKLAAQAIHGAPYDIFLSADMNYPKKLYQAGLSVKLPRLYSRGLLVFFTTKGNLELSNDLVIIGSDNIRKVALPNPRLAPYGAAARDILIKYGLWEKYKDKFVIAENITQTVQFVCTAADLGVVSLSSIMSPKMKRYNVQNKYWCLANPDDYKPIDQGMIILKSSKHKAEAQRFYEYLLGSDAGKIFCKYGYLHPTISKEQFIKGCFILVKGNLKLPSRDQRRPKKIKKSD